MRMKIYRTKAKKPKAPFKYIGGNTKKVSWAKAATVYAIAHIIAKVIPTVDYILVTIKIGAEIIRDVALDCAGATVKYKWYSRKVGQHTNYKTVWSVKFRDGYKTPTFVTYSNV